MLVEDIENSWCCLNKVSKQCFCLTWLVCILKHSDSSRNINPNHSIGIDVPRASKPWVPSSNHTAVFMGTSYILDIIGGVDIAMLHHVTGGYFNCLIIALMYLANWWYCLGWLLGNTGVASSRGSAIVESHTKSWNLRCIARTMTGNSTSPDLCSRCRGLHQIPQGDAFFSVPDQHFAQKL